MKLAAGERCFEHDIAVTVQYKGHHVNVCVDGHDEHPLSRAFGMLDNIDVLFLQNQCSNLIERDSPISFELVVFVLVPNDIHNTSISHYGYNVKYWYSGVGYGA